MILSYFVNSMYNKAVWDKVRLSGNVDFLVSAKFSQCNGKYSDNNIKDCPLHWIPQSRNRNTSFQHVISDGGGNSVVKMGSYFNSSIVTPRF